MKMILNEQVLLDEALHNGYIEYNNPTATIIVLAKHYLYEGKTSGEVYNIINDFMCQYYKDYIMMDWIDLIKRIIRSIKKKGDFSLYKVDEVVVYQSELQQIRNINNLRLEKIAFVLLVYAKIFNKINKKDTNWVNAPYDDVFADAKISANSLDKDLLVYKLKMLGLVKPSMKCNSENIKVLFVESDGEPAIVIKDFRNFVYEYLKYFEPNKYTECQNCGVLVHIKSNKQKYCSKCAREAELEKYKRYNKKRRNNHH